MKKLTVILLVFAFLAISACEKKVAVEAEIAAIKSVLDQFSQVYETENLELFSRIMAHDEDMVNFGTDVAERWVGWEQFKKAVQREFDTFESPRVSVRDQVIKISRFGNVAWFSGIGDFEIVVKGEPISLKGIRTTGVLEKRDGNWVIVQFHRSIPVAGQAVEY
jgi:uncharacterized protein (TIGR02246 family)